MTDHRRGSALPGASGSCPRGDHPAVSPCDGFEADMVSAVIHVIDEDRAVRDLLAVRLTCEGLAVATYDSGRAFLDQREPASGCLLSDVRMPCMTGRELQEALSARGGSPQLILMTGNGDIPLAVRAMKAGAVDFLEKPFSDVRLMEAIGRGLAVTCEASLAVDERSRAAAQVALLTGREREVFDLLVVGHSNKEIARELGTSPRTIDVHRSRVFHKLQAGSLPDLVYLHLAAGRSS